MVIYLAPDAPGGDHRRPRELPAGLHPARCSPTPRPGSRSTTPTPPTQPLATGVPVHGRHLGRGDPAVRPRQPGRRPAAGDQRRAARVPRRPDFQQLTESGLPELQAYPASRAAAADQRRAAAAGRLPGCATPTWPGRTSCWPATGRPTFTTARWARPSCRPTITRPTPGQTVVQLPGIMTTNDLRAYPARVLAPTHVQYRGLDVYGMAPPSSSGSTVGEALTSSAAGTSAAEPRATALFHYLEASRLAYADRNAYVGDPEYVQRAAAAACSSPAFAATRRCLIGTTALTSPVAPGNPYPPYQGCGSSRAAAGGRQEGRHTNNIVTADKWGDIVAYTNTINFFGGSGMTVPRLRVPAQRRDDRLRLRAAGARRLRPQPARGRQAAALQHGPGHRLPARPARLHHRRRGRLDDHHHHLADHHQPRGLRHAAAARRWPRRGSASATRPRRWPSRRSTTARWPTS